MSIAAAPGASSQLGALASRMRALAIMLPLAGLLYTLGLVLRGALVTDADALERWTAPGAFRLAWVLLILGSVTELVSLAALYASLARGPTEGLAFYSIAFVFLNRAIVIGLQWMFLFAPAVGARLLPSVLAAPAPVIALVVVAQLGQLACVVLGVAIWRSGLLPKPAAVLYAFHLMMLSLGARLSYPVEIAGAVFLLASGAWIAGRIHREPA